jgi:hypothetical protein
MLLALIWVEPRETPLAPVGREFLFNNIFVSSGCLFCL